MPIVDIEFVGAPSRRPSAQALADALGRAFRSAPGETWVRLRELPADAYAENELALDAEARPIFVTVLHARPPIGHARQAEVDLLTLTLATALDVLPTRVHVAYDTAGAGRVAFGGQLMR